MLSTAPVRVPWPPVWPPFAALSAQSRASDRHCWPMSVSLSSPSQKHANSRKLGSAWNLSFQFCACHDSVSVPKHLDVS
eukprot:6181058-Pleurochrysis_carterae.AAC.1